MTRLTAEDCDGVMSDMLRGTDNGDDEEEDDDYHLLNVSYAPGTALSILEISF